MTPASANSRVAVATLVPALAGAFAILVGGVVLLGWALDIAALKSVLPIWVAMKPNTAVAFILIGLAVLFSRPPSAFRLPPSVFSLPPSAFSLPPSALLPRLCGWAAGLLGLLSLAEYTFNWNPGFDQWLFPEPAGAVGTSHPGRMAPDTALCFALLAVGWELARRVRQPASSPVAPFILGALVVTIGLVEILSYFAPNLRTYGWGGLTMMALPTSILFAALGMALVVSAVPRKIPSSAGSAQPFTRSVDETSRRFLLIFAGLAVGIITAGTFYYRSIERNFRANAEHQLTAIAKLKVGELAQWRKERLGDASILQNNPGFTQLARRFLASSADADAQRQLQAWLGNYQSHFDYDVVRLLDAQGVSRLSTPAGLPPVSPAIVREAADVLRSGQLRFQDFYRNEHDQRIYLAVLVPVLDDADGHRPLGVVILRIDPEIFIYPFIRRWPVPSATAETLLVRREGNETVFLNELRFQKNTALTLRFSLANSNIPAVQAALGKEGIVEGPDYRGVPALAALHAVPDSPWFMVARRASAEVFAPLRAQLWQVIVMVGVLLFGAGAGVGLVWREQRGRSFQRQMKIAEELRASEFRYRRLFEAAKDGVLILDAETGMVIDVNPFLIELLGFSHEEFLGKKVWELGFLKDLVANQDNFTELQAKEYIRYEDMALETKTGRRIEVEFTSNLYLVNHQRVIQCDIRDISERKAAEEKQRASDVRYRRLFETTKDGILILDAETGMVIDVNPFLIELLGFSHEEFLGKKVWELGFFKDIVANQDNFAELQAKEYFRYEDMALETSTGRRIEVEFTSNLFLVNHQKVIQCDIRDITERKWAAAVLTQERQNLEALFASSPVAMFILDETIQIVRVNAAAIALSGASSAEVLEHRPGNALGCRHSMEDPRGCGYATACRVCATRNGLESVLANGGELKGFELPFELVRHGEVQKVWMAVGAKPILMNGRRHLIVAMDDVTERKRAAEQILQLNATLVQRVSDRTAELDAANRALRTSEQEIRSLAESMPQIVWTTRADGWNTYFNQRWMDYTGLTLEESYGHGWLIPFHPDDKPGAWAAWQRATKDLATYDIECRLRRADGAYCWWLIRGVPQMDADGKILKWFGTCTDIDDIKQKEEKTGRLNDRLAAANQELEAFSYSVSHDLRAPLRSIDGFSRIVLEDYAAKLDADGRDSLNRIRAAAQRMGQLIDDMLNLSRINRAELRGEPVDLSALVRDAAAGLRRQEPAHAVELTVADGLAAVADPRLLRIVLENLLGNAWKFTGKCAAPRIEVGVTTKSDLSTLNAQLSTPTYFIRDNGAGFDEAYAGKLFGAFQRLHSSADFPGTGIGLATVQRIVHRHGGRVWAEARVGQGATFYFTLGAEAEGGRRKAEG